MIASSPTDQCKSWSLRLGSTCMWCFGHAAAAVRQTPGRVAMSACHWQELPVLPPGVLAKSDAEQPRGSKAAQVVPRGGPPPVLRRRGRVMLTVILAKGCPASKRSFPVPVRMAEGQRGRTLADASGRDVVYKTAIRHGSCTCSL